MKLKCILFNFYTLYILNLDMKMYVKFVCNSCKTVYYKKLFLTASLFRPH